MPISCDPGDIAKASACYCGPEDSQRAQIIYLLLQISGLSLTPTQLADAAKCYNCVPRDMQEAETTYLLCQIASNSGA